MSLSTRRLLAHSRPRDGVTLSKALQSTVRPSAIRSMASSSTASDMFHLLGKPLHGARDGHACGRSRGPPKDGGEFVVPVEHLEASDDGFAIGGLQPLQRRLIAPEVLGTNRGFKRRRGFVLDPFRQPADFRTSFVR